jgi:capsular polysaccharide biosynthesis protein
VTYRLEDTDDDEQIRIFQEAEFVIATHGAALSNLAFCHEGTKVIEMSPDSEFRPFFWQIAEKLGLIYGVVPCSSNDGTFHGRVTADIEKLRALFHKFESWSQIPVG